MKVSDKLTTTSSLVVINYIILGLVAVAIGRNALHFYLALSPLIIVLIGLLCFKQSSARMSIVGLIACIVIAIEIFKTDWYVAAAATIYGIIKSFGISIAVIGTMLMAFIMQEVGALQIVAKAVRRVVRTKEHQALFIGVAFGTFISSLGVNAYAMLPPLLIAMGFAPFAAVAVAILGYSAAASFALFSLPIIIPADVFGLESFELAYKICIYLPVIVILISFAMLWMINGIDSMKKGAPLTILTGLTIGISSLLFVMIEVPLMAIGILSGLVAILFLYGHQWANLPSSTKIHSEPLNKKELIKALSPWIILIIFAIFIGIPSVTTFLKKLPGNTENIHIFADQYIDLNFLAQIYLWIFVALAIALILLKPSKVQLQNATKLWVRNIWPPLITFSAFFAIAFVMEWSASTVSNGILQEIPEFSSYNMNMIIGTNFARIFGYGYIYVAAALGLFGAMASTSVTSSNMLFFRIHEQTAVNAGISQSSLISAYGAHSTAGGIATIISPSNINSAVATVQGPTRLETQLLEKNIIIAILLTIAVAIMTGIIINYGL